MTNPPPPPPDFLDPTGHLRTDLPCLTCGYNLRTLAPDARCPECATDVLTSVLAATDPTQEQDWLAAMTSGATLAASGLLLFVLAPLLLGKLQLPEILTSALVLVMFGLPIAGFWYLTVPPPPSTLTASPPWMPQALRIAFVTGLLLLILAITSGVSHPPTLGNYLHLYLLPLGATVTLLGLLAVFHRLRLMARRKQLRIMALLTHASLLLTALFMGVVLWFHVGGIFRGRLRLRINISPKPLTPLPTTPPSPFQALDDFLSNWIAPIVIAYGLFLCLALTAWALQLRTLSRSLSDRPTPPSND